MQAKTARFIGYFRVSTVRQGRSGLGLEAQQEAVRQYLASVGGTLTAEFTEVETGKRNARPELTKALAACKRLKAKLVIAKLDRLSRNVAFLSAMMDGKTEFIACDKWLALERCQARDYRLVALCPLTPRTAEPRRPVLAGHGNVTLHRRF
jgi:DNA invertase Pin-like site-specific DNA recombinase